MGDVHGGKQDPLLVLIPTRLQRSGLVMCKGGRYKAPVDYRLGGIWVILEYDEDHLVYEYLPG